MRASALVVRVLALALIAVAVVRPNVRAQAAPAARAAVPETEGHVAMPDGARLFYRTLGTGGQTVIIPGALFVERDLRQLATRGRTVIMYDMRNRGRSDAEADTARLTIEQDVQDLEAVRRHFGVQRFTPVGFSYLGMMVMMYAAEHPGRIERVIQIGPVPRKYGTEFPADQVERGPVPGIDSAAAAELGRLRAGGFAGMTMREACDREFAASRFRLVGDPRLADRVPSVCSMPNETPDRLARHFGHHFAGVQRLDIPWATFERVTQPVLTIHGTRDRNAPYGAGREWAARLRNARLLTVPGAAHMPWIDQPELVIGGMDAFLRGAWPDEAERVR
jgi:pimeloyl-ACP methyl ester carboxylesterase